VNDGITHAESSAHSALQDEEGCLATEVATPWKSDFVKARNSAEIVLYKVVESGADDAIVALAAKALSALANLLKRI